VINFPINCFQRSEPTHFRTFQNSTFFINNPCLGLVWAKYVIFHKNEILQGRRKRCKKIFLPGAQRNTLEAKGCNENKKKL
jgi:hypothetical protein